MPHYFDNAATQPMRQCAIDAWVAASGFLNAGAQYASGRAARSAVDDARETIARLLGCEPIEVLFTASGTEADNIAIQGLYNAGVAAGRPRRVVSTPIEHPAVGETVDFLASAGAHVDMLPVGADGKVSDLTALDSPAAVATCMWANNETGAIQPVADVVERAQATDTPVHIDAVQVVGKHPVDFHQMGATTLAASAHKFGGPRGTGLLLARRTPAPAPILFGGGQQRGIRPGTVDVAGAMATAAALEESYAQASADHDRMVVLRDRIVTLVRTIDGAQVNSPADALASHINVSFPGTDGDSLLMLLDMAGIEASTGSACHAGVQRPSHVLEAMGVDETANRGTLRFTLGPTTTEADVDVLVARLPGIIEQAKLAFS